MAGNIGGDVLTLLHSAPSAFASAWQIVCLDAPCLPGGLLHTSTPQQLAVQADGFLVTTLSGT